MKISEYPPGAFIFVVELKRKLQLSLVQRRFTGKSNIGKKLKGPITTDARECESIRKELELYMYPLDPGKHLEAIINVTSGQLAAE